MCKIADHENHVRWIYLTTVLCMGEGQKYARTTWNIIRKLNQGLKAKIKTKDGMTRKINIKDGIRQWGVLSVLQYATVMDEIAKEINKKKQYWNRNTREQHQNRMPPVDG